MEIESFIWTSHAEYRRKLRLIDRFDVERAVRAGHSERQINPGRADWLIRGLLTDGRRIEVVYDHPHRNSHTTARIVSVWDF
jgi:hypothetical protein